MRVATFNICHGSRGPATSADTEALVAACVALDADVLALQEVDRGLRRSDREDQAEAVAHAVGGALAWGEAYHHQGGSYGNAVIVRGRIESTEVVPLGGRSRLPHRRHEPRSAVLVTAAVDGAEVSVANTHLSLHRPESETQQLMVLGALVKRVAPRVLLGDLNRRPEWVRSGIEAAGLTLVDGGGPTWPRPRPRYRIDHVATTGLTVDAVEVVDTGVSDHRAVVVDVSVANSSTIR